MLRISPCGHVQLARDGAILFANSAFAQMVGLEPNLLIGTAFQTLLSRGGSIFYETQFAPSLILRGHLDEISFELRSKAGERVPVFVSAIFRRGRDLRADCILMAVFGARQRHMYEAELLRARKESEQLSDVVRRSSDAIMRFSREAQIETWNEGAQQIFGYSSENIVGRPASVLFSEEEFKDLRNAFGDLNRGMDVNRQGTALHANGARIDVSISLTPHIEAPGILVGFSAIIRDIRREKQAERALLQTEKLASVGRLASSIAHEINNPLESVTNLLYILRSKVTDSESQALVATAEEELARVSQIANHTLRFHKQVTNRSEIELHSLVENVLGLYRARLHNSGIEVMNDSLGCSPLLCYENELRQVLLNIVANAFDAMRAGGRLSIRCRDFTDVRSGERSLRITVADTGIGMDQNTVARLFEPFFSTKGIGGTGLGLWISQDLIGRNGGTIRVRSSQLSHRRGTTFLMWFPIVPQPFSESSPRLKSEPQTSR